MVLQSKIASLVFARGEIQHLVEASFVKVGLACCNEQNAGEPSLYMCMRGNTLVLA